MRGKTQCSPTVSSILIFEQKFSLFPIVPQTSNSPHWRTPGLPPSTSVSSRHYNPRLGTGRDPHDKEEGGDPIPSPHPPYDDTECLDDRDRDLLLCPAHLLDVLEDLFVLKLNSVRALADQWDCCWH